MQTPNPTPNHFPPCVRECDSRKRRMSLRVRRIAKHLQVHARLAGAQMQKPLPQPAGIASRSTAFHLETRAEIDEAPPNGPFPIAGWPSLDWSAQQALVWQLQKSPCVRS
jgi:hypothetical protein